MKQTKAILAQERMTTNKEAKQIIEQVWVVQPSFFLEGIITVTIRYGLTTYHRVAPLEPSFHPIVVEEKHIIRSKEALKKYINKQ